MRLYLDDDSVSAVLIRLLLSDGHDVLQPADVGLTGHKDAAHLICAIRTGRALVTRNHDDFKMLHELVILSGGHHPGILVVRRDNDPTRDLSPKGVVRALGNLAAAAVPIPDSFHILNHWR